MNLYVLVEGRRTEKKVYRAWMRFVFPLLTEVEKIEEVKANHFFMLAGDGYPSYKRHILDSLKDISKHGAFDHFMICVDAEEDRVAVKLQEIQGIVAAGKSFPNCHVIVQNCCIETWFLGNQRMLRRQPERERLRKFKEFYDVSKNDPEQMACLADEYAFRAHFHLDYLQEMLRERGLSYTKPNPGCVTEKWYFDALAERNWSTGHLPTFGGLLELWQSWGGVVRKLRC